MPQYMRIEMAVGNGAQRQPSFTNIIKKQGLHKKSLFVSELKPYGYARFSL